MPAHKRKPNYNGATTMQELLTSVCDYYGYPVDDRQPEVSGGELTAEVTANYLRHEHLPDCTLLSETARYQQTDGTLSEKCVIVR